LASDLVEMQHNVSALAREHGISRATVRRRLANGWQPPVTIEGEIAQSNQIVASGGHPLATALASPPAAPAIPATPDGQPWPPYSSAPGRGWRAVSWPLVVIAFGFFGLGIGINIWNAWSTGPLVDVALPATMGVLAEAVMFFLPAWAITLSPGRQVLALALLVFVSAFALTNSLRMASIIAADQAVARADRQTEGTQTADRALETARTRRDEACGRGLGKTIACQARQAEVTKLEGKQTMAVTKVAAQARPESGDFAKLVAWVSRGAIQPGSDDFEMLWLLFRTFLPQVGGLVLMLAQRSA
jgi:hypothetical protein